jgi:16S rRNA (cytosine1402-N4)-methyltransferase
MAAELALCARDLQSEGIHAISGALFDLGVSSFQFDSFSRGFSYRSEAPLDMRMDTSHGITATDVVNNYDVKTLERVIRENSDERFAGRIARAIESARPLRTTTELAEVVASAIPAPARRRGGNPAKRTFQALRIEVNKELEVLQPALEQAISALVPGGRIAVLSYHSGEDRIVKSVMRTGESGGCTCPTGLPCGCGAAPTLKRLRVTAKASAAEQTANPRSTSARLRAAEKVSSGRAV